MPDIRGDPEELDDAESSPAIPAALLAANALRRDRRRTDRQIWALAWPTILSLILASFVSLVDLAMLGRLGTESLAAVGYATQFLMLSQSLLQAIGVVCVALMARAIGSGDSPQARRALMAAMGMALTVAAAVTLLVLSAPDFLLRLLDASPAIIDRARPYFQLTLSSSLLLAVAITMESGFRANKDTRTPLVISGFVTVVKIGLNALLIFGWAGFPRLELVGAGIATLVSQALGVILFFVASGRPRNSRVLHLRAADLYGTVPLLRTAARMAGPAIGERLALHVAILAYFAVLSQYGSVAIAAYTIGVRVLSFSWIPGSGFSVAAATLVGQSLGMKRSDLAVRAGWRAVRFSVGVAFVLGVFYAFARIPIARLFSADPVVVAALDPFMLMLALAQPLLGLHFTLAGSLRGAGDTLSPMWASLVGNWLFRVPLSLLFAKVLALDVTWVWTALIFDHFTRAIILVVVFQRGRWSRLSPAEH